MWTLRHAVDQTAHPSAQSYRLDGMEDVGNNPETIDTSVSKLSRFARRHDTDKSALVA